MAYNDYLADRVRSVFADKHAAYKESFSFGQLNFNVGGKFCVGVTGDELEIRIAPETVASELEGRCFRKLDESGRRLKGFIAIDPSELDTEAQLAEWIAMALDFNARLVAEAKAKPKVRSVKGVRVSRAQR